MSESLIERPAEPWSIEDELFGEWIEYASALEQQAERLERALRLMLDTPKARLAYCQANGLMPEVITRNESVDQFWREQIAKEALSQETCKHPNAVSAKNEVIESGRYCPDCKTLISEIASQETGE